MAYPPWERGYRDQREPDMAHSAYATGVGPRDHPFGKNARRSAESRIGSRREGSLAVHSTVLKECGRRRRRRRGPERLVRGLTVEHLIQTAELDVLRNPNIHEGSQYLEDQVGDGEGVCGSDGHGQNLDSHLVPASLDQPADTVDRGAGKDARQDGPERPAHAVNAPHVERVIPIAGRAEHNREVADAAG